MCIGVVLGITLSRTCACTPTKSPAWCNMRENTHTTSISPIYPWQVHLPMSILLEMDAAMCYWDNDPFSSCCAIRQHYGCSIEVLCCSGTLTTWHLYDNVEDFPGMFWSKLNPNQLIIAQLVYFRWLCYQAAHTLSELDNWYPARNTRLQTSILSWNKELNSSVESGSPGIKVVFIQMWHQSALEKLKSM